jgi:hypothetical protein
VILVRWREKVGNEWDEWQEREFTDDRLQELMDRAWKKYGDPTLILGGPSTKEENANGSISTLKPRRKR